MFFSKSFFGPTYGSQRNVFWWMPSKLRPNHVINFVKILFNTVNRELFFVKCLSPKKFINIKLCSFQRFCSAAASRVGHFFVHFENAQEFLLSPMVGAILQILAHHSQKIDLEMLLRCSVVEYKTSSS